MDRLKKHSSTLKILQKAPASTRNSILQKASKELIRCVCECAHNILKGSVPLTKYRKQKLRKHKAALRQLADKKIALEKKEKSHKKADFFLL